MLKNLENSNIINLLKELVSIIKESYKTTLLSTLIGLFIGIIYSSTLPPMFSVTAVIASNESTQNSSSGGVGLFQGLTAFGGEEYRQIDEFLDALYTYPTAKLLWNKGYNQIFFKKNYSPEQEKYLIKKTPLSEIFFFNILQNDDSYLNKELTPSDLKGVIKSIVYYEDLSRNQYKIVSVTDNPILVETLMKDLLIAADQTLKDEKISYAKEQINFLENKLKTISDIEIRRAMHDAIKSNYLEMAFASSNLPYAVKIIEEPVTSTSIVSPSLSFIWGIFAFLGFSLSLLVIYLRKIFP